MKRRLFCLLVFCLLSVIMAGCGNNVKNEKELIEDIGEEITVLVLDNERIQLHVENLEIERRKTEDDFDQVYCKIEMGNANLSVTSYQVMSYSKFNGNEWYLVSTTPYEMENIEILEPSDVMYNNVINTIQSTKPHLANFSSMIDDCTVTCSENTVIYEIEIARNVGVMSMSGTVWASCELLGDRVDGYYMYTSIDDSDVMARWNVEGTWTGCFGTNDKEVTITVNTLTSEGIDCSWTYEYESWFSTETFSGDSNECRIVDIDDEKIKVGIRFDTALIGSSFIISFYTDGTAKVELPFNGAGKMVQK